MACCDCSSGASGGANKGPAVVDKRNQVLECPHCDRTFQQVQRYREHIAKKHPEESAQDKDDDAPTADAQVVLHSWCTCLLEPYTSISSFDVWHLPCCCCRGRMQLQGCFTLLCSLSFYALKKPQCMLENSAPEPFCCCDTIITGQVRTLAAVYCCVSSSIGALKDIPQRSCLYLPSGPDRLWSLQKSNTLQPGSKGGYYTEKSPRMLLLEWCNQQKRPKPRYKVMAAAADTMRCKVRLACCLTPEQHVQASSCYIFGLLSPAVCSISLWQHKAALANIRIKKPKSAN